MMKYKDWLQEWHEQYVVPTVKPRTEALYKDVIRLYLVPRIGDVEMEALTGRTLQGVITSLIGDGLSSSTVNLVVSVLKASLKVATLMGVVSKDPTLGLVRPKKKEKRIECFTLDEQKRITDFVLNSNKPKHLGVVVCLYTGVRIGELLALEWSDVDIVTGTIRVNKTRVERDGKMSIGTPKTDSSNRIIPFPKQLAPVFKRLKGKNTNGQVIGKDGKPISIRSYQKTFELILKRQGIPHRGFHALRHTFATRAVESGMDVKTLSEILGHKNPTVTLNRYVHSIESHKREMMNRLGKSL